MIQTFTLPAGFAATSFTHMAHLATAVEQRFGSGWAVESIEGGTATVVDGAPNARPGAVRVKLSSAVGSRDGARVSEQLERQGLTTVEFVPTRGYAVGAKVLPAAAWLRGRIAKLLNTAPWEVEVALRWVVDRGVGRLERVTILRMPTAAADPERRTALHRALLSVVPGAHERWAVSEDTRGVVTLRHAVKRELPATVPLAGLLPDRVRPEEWATLPLGVGAAGQNVGLSLELGPHALVVGPTGSGKTIALIGGISAALCRGHEVLLLDALKSGVDFAPLEPYLLGVGTTIEEVVAGLTRVYAEGQRRKEILKSHRVGSWAGLPELVREEKSIRPLTVVIDEYASLVLPEVVPAVLPRDDPEREAAEARNLAKARIVGLTGKIARELRFVGIFLQVALQRPDATVLGGEFRSNLTSAVQLRAPGKPLGADALRMVFGADGAAAHEAFAELDDGRSRGLAVAAADGGELDAFRVAFAPSWEISELLASRGVPEPAEKWDLEAEVAEAAAGPSQPAPFFRRPQQASDVNVGVVEFSLDDLDAAGDDADAPAPFVFQIPDGI